MYYSVYCGQILVRGLIGHTDRGVNCNICTELSSSVAIIAFGGQGLIEAYFEIALLILSTLIWLSPNLISIKIKSFE